MPPFSRPAAPSALALVLLAVAGVAPHAQTLTAVARIEAAFLSKFPQFVDWPPAALDGRTTLDLCIAPPDPFGNELDALVEDETLNGRAIIVRRVDRDRDLEGCHLLFLPAELGPRHPLLARASDQPILTVGDDEDFLDDGGIIRLRVVAGRVRFDVNQGAAERVGLRISSQLLQLALTVVGARP